MVKTSRAGSVSNNELRDLIIEVKNQLTLTGQKLDAVKDKADESERTLKGHNGDPGLVAKVDRLCDLGPQVEALTNSVNNALLKFAGMQPGNEKADPVKEEKAVTIRYLFDKFGAPVLGGVVVWLLVDLLPLIVGHLAQAGQMPIGK